MTGRIKRDVQQFRLPIVGYIKCGYKTPEGLPTSVDYFIPDGQNKEKFIKVYGDQPNVIQIMFPSDNIEDVCYERYEIMTSKKKDGVGGKLFAEGDGQTFKIWTEEKQQRMDYNILDYPDIMKMCETKSGGKWKAKLTLRFIIPSVPVFGIWELNTSGEKSSIIQIRSMFDLILEKRGTVQNMQFDLNVRKAVSSEPGSRKSYPVIGLLPLIKDDGMNILVGLNQIENLPEEKIKQLQCDGELKLEAQNDL